MTLRDIIYTNALRMQSGNGSSGEAIYPNIIIDVIELAAGEKPTVEKSGTPASPIFTIGIPVGSLINEVYLGDTLLDIVDGKLKIPIATPTTLGLVRGSEEISILADGTLRLEKINIDKLENNQNTTLILNGGTSEN